MKGTVKIGHIEVSPPVFLAPMAGITDCPTRLICREFGAPFAFTEMVPAAAFARGNIQPEVMSALKTHPLDRPLGIQIFGYDPDEMAKAAGMLAYLEADVIDINMGCPVKKIVKNGSGAAIMNDPERARLMVAKTRKAVSVPLTVKMRTGWDDDSVNAVEIAKICEGEGADAVTIHGRTRSRWFIGEPDFDTIAKVVEAVKIPVIGNGGINSVEEAESMMERTGCAGVMIARAMRGDPWIFERLKNDDPDRTPSMEERARVMLRHFNYMLDYFPERKAAVEMRKHLCWYSRGIPSAVQLRRELQHVERPEKVRELVEQYFLSTPVEESA